MIVVDKGNCGQMVTAMDKFGKREGKFGEGWRREAGNEWANKAENKETDNTSLNSKEKRKLVVGEQKNN